MKNGANHSVKCRGRAYIFIYAATGNADTAAAHQKLQSGRLQLGLDHVRGTDVQLPMTLRETRIVRHAICDIHEEVQ